MLLRPLAAILLAAPLAAQATAYPHLVLTRLPGTNPAAAIVAVDTATSTITPLGRFATDNLPPLAITLDPFDRHLLVALDLGTGNSRIVRLERIGSAFIEHPMFDLPGRITAMTVSGEALLAASDGGGGLWRAPRRGGQTTLAYPQVNLTAMHGYGYGGTALLLAWTGRPGTAAPDCGVVIVDAATGTPFLGPHTFANPTGQELTGAVDLPTGVPRQLLSFADGSFWLFAGLIGPPTQVPTSVMIPPGGAAALAPSSPFGSPGLALGGSAFPHLYEVDFWTGTVTLRCPALPGDPVDFCNGGERAAQALVMSERCGPVTLQHGWSGSPQPGSTLSIEVLGPPTAPLFLVVGLSDFPGLPIPLPGGCVVDVAPDAVSFVLSSPTTGLASRSIAVPPGPAFLGTILFAQWLHLGPTSLSASSAIAYQIGQ